jgi:hypothetical protein
MCVLALWFRVGATGLCLLLGIMPAAADLLIVVDKSAQRMSVSVDGTPRYIWKVSTGRPGYDTPAGSFHPFRLERDHFSKEWDDAPMPHSIFFTTIGHAIHGSYDTRHLGTPVSHGCVRIAPANAALLFSLVEAEGLGRTKIVVAGGAPAVARKSVKTPARPRLFAPTPVWPDAPDQRQYWPPPPDPPGFGPYDDGEYQGDGW